MSKQLTDLGDDLGADYLGDVRIYDTRGYSPQLRLTMSDEAAWAFVQWYTDGMCPCCGEEIPQDHIVCRPCLGQAMHAWGIRVERERAS